MEERQIANIVRGLSKCCGKFCKGQHARAQYKLWREENRKVNCVKS
jgi:hypothetical protein